MGTMSKVGGEMGAEGAPSGASSGPGLYSKVQGPYSEEDLYVAVTRAWCRLPSRQIRRERPVREYVFGWRFVSSVERLPTDVKSIIRAVLQIVTRSPSPNDSAIAMPLETEADGQMDAVAAWWHLIEATDDLGVHYVERTNGTLALLTVAGQDEQPDPRDWR